LFPEAANVVETYPTVDATVTTFQSAGFGLVSLDGVAQRTVGDLPSYRARVSNRSADTTLQLISDDAYARGLARLDAAIAGGDETPVVDALDLLVFR
jgi:hypothetical protein